MNEQLQPITAGDAFWLNLHRRQAFRFRPASADECRIAGVQNPDAIAIVTRACGGNFLMVAAGEAAPDREAVEEFIRTLDLPADIGGRLSALLPRVRPNTLAHAAARLMRAAPWCKGCRCGVRWTVLLAGLAEMLAPRGEPGLAELEAEWLAFKTRSSSIRSVHDEPVVKAANALREIGRTA